jgi:carbonic anhydrase
MDRKTRGVVVALVAACGLVAAATARLDDHAKPDHGDSHAPAHGAADDHGAAKPAPKAKDDRANPFKAGSRKADAPAKAKAQEEAKPAKSDDSHDANANSDHAQASQPDAPKPAKPSAPNASATLTEPGAVSADEALTLLKEGNERWANNSSVHPAVDSARRETLAAEGQRPFATILTCADSRIPVERVFDRGVGEIFAIRVAGNVSGASETGTIEYGLGHLKTRLLVVMGHTKCGAVAAAAGKAELHGAVGDLVNSIQPAVQRAQRQHPELDAAAITPYAIKENVWQSVFGLLKSDEIRELVSKGDVKVVGAVYDIASGKVEWLGEHPWQHELLAALESRKQADTVAAAHAGETTDSTAAPHTATANADEHK